MNVQEYARGGEGFCFLSYFVYKGSAYSRLLLQWLGCVGFSDCPKLIVRAISAPLIILAFLFKNKICRVFF